MLDSELVKVTPRLAVIASGYRRLKAWQSVTWYLDQLRSLSRAILRLAGHNCLNQPPPSSSPLFFQPSPLCLPPASPLPLPLLHVTLCYLITPGPPYRMSGSVVLNKLIRVPLESTPTIVVGDSPSTERCVLLSSFDNPLRLAPATPSKNRIRKCQAAGACSV